MKTLLILPFVFVLSFCSDTVSSTKENRETKKTSVQNTQNNWTYKAILINDNGWGYQLFRGSHLEINQRNIPAVNGLHYFKTEEKANKAAEFALTKIEQGFFPPTVSPEELDSIGAIDLEAIEQATLEILKNTENQ